MALVGSTVKEQIWNYLKSKGLNNYGIAGLMGNLYAESALNPKNLQQSHERKLGYTDESYTKAVDDGSYDNFVRDSAGYGLAQWTYWSRKKNMLDYASKHCKSIGDLEMQLAFLFDELKKSYPTVLSKLKTARSVKAASDAVLTEYEKPADQSERVKLTRSEYGQKFYDEFAKKKESGTMTESQLRQKIVGIMQGWIGYRESDGSHRKIIDIYNSHKPLARGYAVKYTDAWCATTVSAAAIVAGLTDIIPTECSCNRMIEAFKKIGAWQENDAYAPAPGDIIFYDWQDNGCGDNVGSSDHVGIVEKLVNNTMTIIEGNKNNEVGRRTLAINSIYIRGYGVPKYSGKATVASDNSWKIGDTVTFIGNKHYTSSYANASAKSCKAGKAKVTALNKNGTHPYHLVAVSSGGSNVYGWVNAEDIK